MLLATSIAPPFLVQSVALVVAAAAIAYICYRIGLVPIVGFLLAGVVIVKRSRMTPNSAAAVTSAGSETTPSALGPTYGRT